MFENRIVIEPDGLLEVEGLAGAVIFPLADFFLSQKEEGTVTLIHAGGELQAPSAPTMLEAVKKYKDGTKLKIKGREFKTSCTTVYLTKSGRWSLECCINPIEQKEGCFCGIVIGF